MVNLGRRIIEAGGAAGLLGFISSGCTSIWAKREVDFMINRDIVIVEKTEDAASLDESLELGFQTMERWGENGNKVPEIVNPNDPSFLFVNLDVKKSGKFTAEFSTSQSRAVILNNKGYFVTAYHCMEDLLSPATGRTLIYDGASKRFFDGRLAYSTDCDLALGKFDPPEDYQAKVCPVSRTFMPPSLGIIYTTDLSDFKKELVTQGAALKVLENKDYTRGMPLSPDVIYGAVLGMNQGVVRSVFFSKEEMEKVMAGESEGLGSKENFMTFGDSGSPIFTSNNELVGLHISSEAKQSNGGRYIDNFSGPENVCFLIRNYTMRCID